MLTMKYGSETLEMAKRSCDGRLLASSTWIVRRPPPSSRLLQLAPTEPAGEPKAWSQEKSVTSITGQGFTLQNCTAGGRRMGHRLSWSCVCVLLAQHSTWRRCVPRPHGTVHWSHAKGFQ